MGAIRRSWGLSAWGVCGATLLLAGCGLSGSTSLEQAREHYRAAEWDLAAAACDDALRESPDSIDALLLRGRVRLAAGQIETAAGDFARVIRLDPANPEGFYQRSLAFTALGKTDEAAADQEHARDIDIQDAALLRRHASTLQMPEAVRSGPAKQTGPDDTAIKIAVNERSPDDERRWSFDPPEQPAEEDKAAESPLLAPNSSPDNASSDPLSIVGGTKLLDSSLLSSSLIPRPAKKPPSEAPPETPDETKKPAATPRSAAQSSQSKSQPNAGPEHDLPTASASRPLAARQPGPPAGTEESEARQSKYPIARLSFISPSAQPHSRVAAAAPRAKSHSLMPPPFKPRSLMPESTLVRLGIVPPPEEAEDAESQEPPGFVAIQLRGFTPDAPPWPLSMPSDPGRRRGFELPESTPAAEPIKLDTTSTERAMPAPRKGPPPPKLPFDE